MTRYLTVALTVCSLLAGCLHARKTSQTNSLLDELKLQAVNELESLRTPFQAPVKLSSTTNVAKRSPNAQPDTYLRRFTGVMFPRLSLRNRKTTDEWSPAISPLMSKILLPPVKFEMELTQEQCPQANDSKTECFKYVIRDTRWDTLPANKRRFGDFWKRQGIADGNWNIIKETFFIASKNGEWEAKSVDYHNLHGIQSGLTPFPVDWPSLNVQKSWTKAKLSPGNFELDDVTHFQFKKLLGRELEALTCQGWEVKYEDVYGFKQHIGWCDFEPIPRFISNSKYIAIWFENR